jgi:hypothetical protein
MAYVFSSIDASAGACQHRVMRNLTPIECLFIWRTGSLRLRIGLALWLAGLRRFATRVAKSERD